MPATRTHRASQRFVNPRSVEKLLGDRRTGYLWFFLRLYVGWQWISAGWHKLVGPASLGWVRDGTMNGKVLHHGDKLLAFWQHAVAPPANGMPQVGYPWYRDFLISLIHLHVQGWLTYLVAGGEFLVGLALILGAFTALASLAGAALNFNYMLAGSASINPVLFGAELLLILAWKGAGYVGLDRWLLPMLGTPWQPGWLFQRGHEGISAGRYPSAPGRRAAVRIRRRLGSLRRRRHSAVTQSRA